MWLPQFSNFHRRAVSYDGDWYSSNEHAYQAAKTLDPQQRSEIRQCGSPGAAKRLGSRVDLRPDWEQLKQQVMLDLCRQKFALPPMAALLLATGNQVIVEENTWHDNVWGDCSCAMCAAIPGQNLLGKLLMQVRAELSAQAGTPAPVPQPEPARRGKTVRIVIAGSRDRPGGGEFTDFDFVAAKLDTVCAKLTGPIVVLSGTARGADRLGEQWAVARGHQVEQFPANWTALGPGAGMVRNREMIDQATHACFFWNGYSSGAKDAIAVARKREIPVRVWLIE